MGSEFTVESLANTFTAMIDIHTLAARPTKTGFVLLADGKGFTIRMVSTLHLLLSSIKKSGRTPFDAAPVLPGSGKTRRQAMITIKCGL